MRRHERGLNPNPHTTLIATFNPAPKTQYIDFLRKAMSEAEYMRMLPPLAVLREEYALDWEVIFQLYR